MSHFNINPNSGSGTTSVQVSPQATNYSGDDYKTALVVSNGTKTKRVNVVQYFCPTITQFGGSPTVPATGGTLMYTVRSHYDFCFRSKPSWVTIRNSDGTVTYSEGEKITNPGDGYMYIFIDVAPNTNTSSGRTSGSFNMGHYINNVLQNQTASINFSQLQADIVPGLNVSPAALVFDYNQNISKTFSVNAVSVSAYTVTNSDTTDFQLSSSTGASGSKTFTATTRTYNNSGYDLSANFVVSDNSGQAASKNVSAIQYFVPTITQFGSSPTVPASGGTLMYSVRSHYDFYFDNVPGWVTIRNSDNTHTYAQGELIQNRGNDYIYIFMDVDANTLYQPRGSGSLRMKHMIGSTTASTYSSVTFTQLAAEPVNTLTVSPASFSNVPSTGSTQTATITATGSWYLSYNSDFLTVSPTTGASGTTNVTITVANNTGIQRNGAAFFALMTDEGVTGRCDISQVAYVQKYIVEPSEDFIYVWKSIEGVDFDLQTNCERVLVDLQPSEYFDYYPEVAVNDDNIGVYTISDNYSGEDRNAVLTLTDPNNEAAPVSILITQQYFPVLEVVSGNTRVPASGGTIQYKLRTEYDYAFNNIPSWITVTNGSGYTYTSGTRVTKPANQEVNIYVTVAENRNTSTRNSTSSSFSMGHYYNWNNNQETTKNWFDIIQEAFVPVLTPNPTAITLDYTQNSTNTFQVNSNVTGYTVNNPDTTNFSLSSTSGGTGSKTFTVTGTTYNNTGNDLTTALLITDNNSQASSTNVYVTQYFLPTITQFGGSSTVQGTGGTLMYSVRSHYDFVFRSVPSWVTIRNSDGTEVYTEGQRIPNPGDGYIYIFMDVAANTSSSNRNSGTFNMGHYIGNTLQTFTASITFTQLATIVPAISVSPSSIILDYPSGSTATFTATTNVNAYTVANNNTTNFQLSSTSGGTGSKTFTIGARNGNTSSEDYEATITLTDNGGQASTQTVSVTQWNKPTITQFGGSSNVPGTGGTLMYTVKSHYDFVFRSVPSWVTITNEDSTITYTEGQTIHPQGDYQYIFISVAANPSTSSSRNSGTFNMGHYINGVLQASTSSIAFTQLAAPVTPTISISPNAVHLDYDLSDSDTFTVVSNVNAFSVANSNSSDFTVSPASGASGTTTVTATSRNYNNTGAIKTATLTISDNGGQAPTVTADVVQYFLPTITQFGGSSTVPSTGGTLMFTVKSYYDFCFRSVPSWVHLYDGNNPSTTYTEGQRITNTGSGYKYVFMDIDPNYGAQRNSGSLNMGHYKGNTLQSTTASIVFTQSAGSAASISVSPDSLTFNYSRNSTATFTVTTNVTGFSISNSNTSAFSVSPTTGGSGNTVITVTATTYNSGSSGKTGTLTISDNAGIAASQTVSLLQYNTPSITRSGSGIVSYGGAELTYTVKSYYPYSFKGIPGWITIYNSTKTESYSSSDTLPSTSGNAVTYKFVVDPNTGSSRSTSSSFYLGYYMPSLQSETIQTISQQAVPQFAIYPTSAEILPCGDGVYVNVVAPVGTASSISSFPSWCHPEITAGTGSWEVAIQCDNNTGSTSRSGSVVFTSNLGTQTLTIEQIAAPQISVSPSTITAGRNGGTYTFQVTSDTEWYIIAPEVGSSDDWWSVNNWDGIAGTTTVTLTVNALPGWSNRSTTISVITVDGCAFYDLTLNQNYWN